MEGEHRDKQIPVFRLDGRKNKMEFIRGFKQVADHFGITRMVYEDIARPAGEDEAGSQAKWDNTNRVALEKLRFYVTTRVDDTVTNGDELTAREYYLRLQGLFLRTGSESVATLQKRLTSCTYTSGEDIFSWIARLDGIFTQFKAANSEIPDLEKKHRAMGLLVGVPMWGPMAQLLGTGDHISYFAWKQAMLAKDEELDLNGEMTNQELADELYGQRTLGERAFPATAIHQTFRGSGFIQRGGAQARGRTGMHMRGVSRAHGSNLARGGFQSFGGSAGGVLHRKL